LTKWAEDENIVGGIEIKNVFYQPPPAVSQLYSTTLMTGQGGLGGVPAAGLYGFGYGFANYLMMPTSFNMQNIQAIEMQNIVMLSNYTFNIVNNILTVFPIPGSGGFDFGDEDTGDLGYGHFLIFDFIKIQERLDSAFTDGTDSDLDQDAQQNFIPGIPPIRISGVITKTLNQPGIPGGAHRGINPYWYVAMISGAALLIAGGILLSISSGLFN
jgi:hypothetical protein